MEKYLVFEDAKGNPIGLPNKVSDTTEADAILEYVPDDCCYQWCIYKGIPNITRYIR